MQIAPVLHALEAGFERTLADLVDLARIPSVSAAGFDPAQVVRSAERVAELLQDAGLGGVELLRVGAAHPSVYGEWLGAGPAALVVIGLGARGAFLAVRESGLRLELPAVVTRPVVQTGGAGDALFAAFLHGYLRSRDPARALRAAMVFASYKIGAARSGEGFLTHDELERLLAQVGGA